MIMILILAALICVIGVKFVAFFADNHLAGNLTLSKTEFVINYMFYNKSFFSCQSAALSSTSDATSSSPSSALASTGGPTPM